MERTLQTHALRRQTGCWAGPLLTSDGRSQTYMARDSLQDEVEGSPTLVFVTPEVKNEQLLSCLSSSFSSLQRPVWTKSWITGAGGGCKSVVRPSLKMELRDLCCARTSPNRSEYVHNAPAPSYSTWGDLVVQSSVCSATSSSMMTILQLLKPLVPATTISPGTPVQIWTLKLGSTMTGN